MSEDVKAPRSDAQSGIPKSGKKPYETPAFRFEGVFETMALTCGKINATQGSCTHNLKLS